MECGNFPSWLYAWHFVFLKLELRKQVSMLSPIIYRGFDQEVQIMHFKAMVGSHIERKDLVSDNLKIEIPLLQRVRSEKSNEKYQLNDYK